MTMTSTRRRGDEVLRLAARCIFSLIATCLCLASITASHLGDHSLEAEKIAQTVPLLDEQDMEVIRETLEVIREDLDVPLISNIESRVDREKTAEHLLDGDKLAKREAVEDVSERKDLDVPLIPNLESRCGRDKTEEHLLDEDNEDIDNIETIRGKLRKRRAFDASPTPNRRRDNNEGHSETRPTSSNSGDNLECLMKSSCSVRDIPKHSDIGHMFPCMCDDQCYLYGDCCYDHASVSLPPPAVRPVCRLLTPIAGRHYAFHHTVFLVNQCPEGSEPNLTNRCRGEATPSYLMDIPVFSKTTGIGYSNIFCATCHNDMDIHKFEISISCLGTVNSTTELKNMIYHEGELRWSSLYDISEDTGSCLLDVAYPLTIGRWCQLELVDTCKEDWLIEENVRRCSAYNYYVQSGSSVYKNRDCAICNGVPQDEIQCLPLFKLRSRGSFPPPHSLMELFEVRGDCKDDEVWDVLNRRCEHVACGFLFTLQDGVCERSNATLPADGQSYLNASCYIMEYNQSFMTSFPNQSIYLNETQRLYHFGEYEFNGTLIRVCDEKESWTPFMHILSSVLIIISLVCLVAHMVIFVVLPKRRNIPSMNLFSMTVSLFMAEFMFLTFFQLKVNHVTCIISGVLMYYFLCVSFLWMNVMSIDIFRTFYSSTYRTKSLRIFTQYSLYAWILPMGGVAVALVVDKVWPDFIIAPHFGTNSCWLNNKWGLVAFFTFPSGIVILANLVLYMVSVRNIYIQIKTGEIASSTIRKNDGSSKYSGPNSKTSVDSSGRKVSQVSSEKNPNGSELSGCKERLRGKFNRGFLKKHRGRLILYCKLALIMGMTWIFAFISIHTKNIVFEYLFIIFNGLQGTFIFVAFDLKKKVWEDLWTKNYCYRKHHENFAVQVKSGTLKTTSDGDHKNSYPCSSQKFNKWRTHSASTSATRNQPSHSTAESEV